MTNEDSTRIVARSEHSLSRRAIDANALGVLRKLNRAGFKGFLVGGSVRDLMLGRKPKDFDVATDASPNQARRLFRNSRIIGRRFRLVHVYFQGDIVELATFRRDPDPDEQASAPGDLLITSDNVFGTPRQDAFRRDFTVNALFYDIGELSVIDYVGGIDDLEAGIIRTIGDPDVRFREDPVRMMRACEMAGRLGFTIDGESQDSMRRLSDEIRKAAPARITEEILQLLRCGAAGPAMKWMRELGLLSIIFPEADLALSAGRHGAPELEQLIPAIDSLVARGRELSDASLLAALMLPSVLLRRREVEEASGKRIQRRRLRTLIEEVTAPFFERHTVAKFKAEAVGLALDTFHSLGERRWNVNERIRLARRTSFGDALELFAMMVEATGEGREDFEAWDRVRREMPPRKGLGKGAPRPGVRRRRRRRSGRRV
jgi:poly(A) polymerase